MNALTLALASIRSRRLHAALCITAAATGIAVLCVIFLLSQAVEDGLSRNARGIDVIVGAKGSPLQLVLSSIYHADVPNGNIDMNDMERIANHPGVAKVIPLALGDNYKGNRIVGTTPDYLDLYKAEFAQGSVFTQDYDAVAGASTGLAMGTQFAAVHGLSIDSDDVHNFHLYTIKGVLKPTGTVLDRLILTGYGSVQDLHSHPDAGDPDAKEELQLGHQVTALLLKVRSPIGVINIPREINRSSNLLAASPAYVMTRFSQTMGLSRDVLTALGVGFVVLSTLMLLSALASSLTARRYDLGVLRVLGSSPSRLFATVMAEGLLLSGGGAIIGLFAGHLLAFAIASGVEGLRGLVIPAGLLIPQGMDIWFLMIGFSIGLAAGLVPAIAGARTDLAGLLARGRS